MVSNNHIFVDKVEGDKVEGGFVTVPSPTPGVGKQQLLPKLADSLKDLPFLMCGPPGTGKHNLATEKANLKMNTYDLGHISNDFRVRHRDLETMLNRYGGKLQTNLMGVRSLLVLQKKSVLTQSVHLWCASSMSSHLQASAPHLGKRSLAIERSG